MPVREQTTLSENEIYGLIIICVGIKKVKRKTYILKKYFLMCDIINGLLKIK